MSQFYSDKIGGLIRRGKEIAFSFLKQASRKQLPAIQN